MAVSGHEEWFPPANLSAGYRFRKQTIAGTRGNDEDAPKPVIGRDLRTLRMSGLDSFSTAVRISAECRIFLPYS
jgi:hypothetical protein